MASDAPGPEKTPRPSRNQGPKASTTSHLAPTQIKTNTEVPIATIDHVLEAKAQHIKSLDRERRQYLTNNKELRVELNRVRSEMEDLRPELATAREKLRTIESAALISSIFVAIGGAAVSAAGYFNESLRRGILIGGVATLICGLVLQIAFGRRSKA
jgi:hypothetical protein